MPLGIGSKQRGGTPLYDPTLAQNYDLVHCLICQILQLVSDHNPCDAPHLLLYQSVPDMPPHMHIYC